MIVDVQDHQEELFPTSEESVYSSMPSEKICAGDTRMTAIDQQREHEVSKIILTRKKQRRDYLFPRIIRKALRP